MGDGARRDQLRKTFDEEAERYHRARPGYPAGLFEAIAEAGGLRDGSRVLEVGPGTGQATRAMAERGWDVTAIELGPRLAAVAARELADLTNVEVVVGDVETIELPGAGFDAVVAFTSFHWLGAETRLARVAELLAEGGLLAVVETHHVRGGTTRFFEDVQDCYLRWDPDTDPGHRLPAGSEIEENADDLRESPTFTGDHCLRVEQELGYSTSEYLELLQTYSGHLAMPLQAREGLLCCIRALIEGGYEGRIRKRYLHVVRTARREGTR